MQHRTVKPALTPEFLAWREAQIRHKALQAKYRRLCRRPDVPVTAIVACLQATEAAQAVCRRLKKPEPAGAAS